MSWREFDQNVDVAIGSKIVAHDRAEEGQLTNVMAPAEGGQLFAIDRHSTGHFNASLNKHCRLGSKHEFIIPDNWGGERRSIHADNLAR